MDCKKVQKQVQSSNINNFPILIHYKCNLRHYVSYRALDNITLATLLEQVLNPVSLEGETNIEELNIRSILASRLQFYRAAGLSGIKVLLKAEKIKKASFR